MDIQLNNDQVTALMNQLPADAIGQAKGFDHIGSTLYIPDAYAAAATAIMAVAGWDQYVPPQTTFTPRALIETLFTAAEQQAIFTAAQTNWQVSKFIALVTAMQTVNIRDPEFIADIGAVQTIGLLTAPRAAQILAGTPAPTA